MSQVARRGMRPWAFALMLVLAYAWFEALDTSFMWRIVSRWPLWLMTAHNDLMQAVRAFAHMGTLAFAVTLVVRFGLWRQARAQIAAWSESARVRRWAIAIPTALSVVWSVVSAPHFLAEEWRWFVGGIVVQRILDGIAVAVLARMTLNAFVDQRPEGALPRDTDPHEIVFSAVADTTTARVLVALMMLVGLAMCSYVAGVQVSESHVFGAVLTYACAAIGGAALFRRASRIRVGLDGVLVTGAARRMFLPWSKIDDVVVDGVNIVVKSGARELVRLQPHGDDAERKDALAARFRDAFLAAQRAKQETAHVHASHAAEEGGDRLADSMRGASDYRIAAVTREQLWSVVEGPAAAPKARVLAAEALTHGLEEGERARLRVAAEMCADPEAKASLVRLLATREELEERQAAEELEERLAAAEEADARAPRRAIRG